MKRSCGWGLRNLESDLRGLSVGGASPAIQTTVTLHSGQAQKQEFSVDPACQRLSMLNSEEPCFSYYEIALFIVFLELVFYSRLQTDAIISAQRLL